MANWSAVTRIPHSLRLPAEAVEIVDPAFEPLSENLEEGEKEKQKEKEEEN